MKTVRMACPLGCNFVSDDSEVWKKHFKDKHPEIKSLKLGKDEVDLK